MSRPASNARRRVSVKWAIRAAVSALVLGLILSLLPSAEIWAAIESLPLWLWLGVLALFLAGHLLAAGKWWLLALRRSGIPLHVAIKAHYAGLAANLCLPGIAGGDVVRAGLVMRDSERKTLVAVGSLLDRLLDSLALLLLACVGALFSMGSSDWSAAPLGEIGAFLLVLAASITLLAKLLPRLPARGITKHVAPATAEFAHRPGALAACLALSTLIQAGFVGLNVALAGAIGLSAPAVAWFFAWPLAKLVAVVPISLSGLGVREASLAALMAPFGANAAQVVAVGLLWQSVLFAGGLIGGLAMLMWKRSAGPVHVAESPSAHTSSSGLAPGSAPQQLLARNR